MHQSDAFEAFGFHEQLEGGRTSGQLHVRRDGVVFLYEGGEVLFPGHQLRLRLGGASDRLLFIENDRTPGWTVYTADHGILTNPTFLNLPDIETQIEKVKKKKRTFVTQLGLIAMLVVGLIAGFILAKPWMVARIADHVPPEWETELGDLAFSQFDSRVIRDPELERLLADFTAILTDHVADSRYAYRFYLLEDESINAFAFPGGNMVIHTGAILASDRGEEVLGVLAHEIAHVNNRHSIKGMINSLGTSLLISALVGDATALGALLHNTAPLLDERQFSRDNERDADSTGMQYLLDSGVDPSGLIDFFGKIQQEHEKSAAGVMDGGLNFLSTHPATGERIEALETEIAQLPEYNYRKVETVFNPLKQRLQEYLGQQATPLDGENENNN